MLIKLELILTRDTITSFTIDKTANLPCLALLIAFGHPVAIIVTILL